MIGSSLIISTSSAEAAESTPKCDSKGWGAWDSNPVNITRNGNQFKITPKHSTTTRQIALLDFDVQMNGSPLSLGLYFNNLGTNDTHKIEYQSCTSTEGEKLWREHVTIGTNYQEYTDTIRINRYGIITHWIDYIQPTNGGGNISFRTGTSNLDTLYEGSTFIQWNGANGSLMNIYSSTEGEKITGSGGETTNATLKLSSTHTVLRQYFTQKNEGLASNLNANGGVFPDGTTKAERFVLTNDFTKMDDPPTRTGYLLKGWNSKADGTGSSNVWSGPSGSLYAQWEKDPGKPSAVNIECSDSKCAISTDYPNSESNTRIVNFSNPLQWDNFGGINGVRLDDKGYKARSACRGTNCVWVSLNEKPDSDTVANYSAQMPTTGAPEGLTTVGVIALVVLLTGVSVLMVRRQRA